MHDKTTHRAAATDEPIATLEDDALGFVPRYAIPLARQIASTSVSDSLTIGIYGPWGSGKTSLMNLIRALMNDEQRRDEYDLGRASVTVRYTAWKYAQEESLWRTLVRVILDELLQQADEHDQDKRVLRDTLYGDIVSTRRKLRIDWPRLIGGVVSLTSLVLSSIFSARHVPVPPAVEITLAGVALGGAAVTAFGVKWASKTEANDKPSDLAEKFGTEVKDIAQAVQVVDDVLTTHRRVEYIEQFAESFELIVKKFLNGRRLVVFIDDLDRCLPEKSIQVLEGIKLFLGVPGTVFVLGVDITALAYAVETHYARDHSGAGRAADLASHMNGARYLEKVIQFSFHLPPMQDDDLAASHLVAQLCESKDDRRWLEIGIRGFAGNPRALKRFARLYRNRLDVIATSPENLAQDRELHLAKLVVLQEHHQWRELIDIIASHTVSVPQSLLREGPLALLEKASIDGEQRGQLLTFAGAGIMSRLAKFAADESLMKFLRSEPRFDGEDPIDPLPLIRLGGGSAAPSTALQLSSLDDIVRDINSEDRPTRAQAISAARNLSNRSRRQLIERLLSQVAGQSQSSNLDDSGLPLTIRAIATFFEQEIERELIAERLNWFIALSAHTEKHGTASQSRQELLRLLAKIGSANGSAPPVSEASTAGILSDQPTSEDALGTVKYVRAVAQAIQQSDTPLTVGIFGKWGTGKTSFLHLLEREMDCGEECLSSFVNAWQLAPDRSVQVFLMGLEAALSRDGEFADLIEAVGGKETPQMVDVIQRRVDEALGPVIDRGGRVVLYLDDLDRCLPSFQLEMMETLHGIFRVPGLVVVLAADRDIMVQAARARFDLPSSESFVDELIDVPFALPQSSISTGSMLRAFMGDTVKDNRVDALARYLDPNPRMMKRFVNQYRLCVEVARQDADTVDLWVLAMLVLIASRWPRLIKDPALLIDLWKSCHEVDFTERPELLRRVTEDLELLDTDDLVAFFEQEGPPSDNEVLRGSDLVRRVLRP